MVGESSTAAQQQPPIGKQSTRARQAALTIGVLERLLLLGRLGDDLDALAEEDADVLVVAVEHLHRQHEVLALVRVGDVQRLRRAVALIDTHTHTIC